MDSTSLVIPKLRQPLKNESGLVVARVALNLTVYMRDVSEEDLISLINLSYRYCLDKRMALYTIGEWHGWAPIDVPRVTDSVAAAMAVGSPRLALAPVARRIREARGFELRFWDGNEIENGAGSWSFACLKLLRRGRDAFCPVTFSFPLTEDPALLLKLACDVAKTVPIHSGHGGLAFTYHPYRKVDAFKVIYALAKRFWGIDVEDLNASARSTGESIKTINWLTLLGHEPFATVVDGLRDLTEDGTIALHNMHYGTVVRVGNVPDPLDVHRPTIDAYFRLARRLISVLPTEHPAFEGAEFEADDSTIRWLRRFADQDAWRP